MQNLLLRLFVILIFFNVSKGLSAKNVEDIDSLVHYLQNVIPQNDNSKRAEIAYQIAQNYSYQGEADKAINYAKQTIEYAGKINDTVVIINSLNILAESYHTLGNFDDAIESYSQSINYSKLKCDTILWANSLENLGTVYGTSGKSNFSKSLEILLEAARLKEEAGYLDKLAITYAKVSSVFKNLNDTLNREKYLIKSIEIVESGESPNLSFNASVYNEAGRFYTEEKQDFELAEKYFNQVLKISRSLQWIKGIAVSLCNLANVEELRGNYQRSMDLHHEALAYKTEINYVYGIVNSHHSIGNLLVKQNKLQLAIEELNYAKNLALENMLFDKLKEIYYDIYQTYKKTNDINDALNSYERYTALADSLNGERQKKTVVELETKYETEKKEQQIEKLTAEKEIEKLKTQKQRLITSILGFLVLFIVGLSLIINRQNRLKRKRREEELKHRLFRSQMNPHFIFNALASIQNYIYTNEPDEAAGYLSNFSALMRDILEGSANEYISVEQELNIVNNYCGLQKMRKNDIFDYTIENNIDGEYVLPPMLAQPFIENAIIHAFKGVQYKGLITIRYYVKNHLFYIEIEDNGIGYDSRKNHSGSHKSVAIQLTQKRIALLNTKKQKASMEIHSINGNGNTGTIVRIKIPLEKCLKF